MISKFEKYTKDELQDILDNSNTYKEVLEKIGLAGIGNNYKTLNKYIEKYNLSTEHIDCNRKNATSHAKYNTKEKFIEAITNGTCKAKTQVIINKFVEYGLKEYCCEICEISNWNDKYIRLELHHKNGDHNDNRLCNLQLLCPNCHSQTDNFRALNISNKENTNKKYKRKRKTKLCPICNINEINYTSKMCRECYVKTVKNPNVDNNNNIIKLGHNLKDLCPVCETNYKSIKSKMCDECRKKERKNNIPPKEELELLIYKLPFTKIGEMYGVSDNTIRKWCKLHELPYYKKDIKELRGKNNEQ